MFGLIHFTVLHNMVLNSRCCRVYILSFTEPHLTQSLLEAVVKIDQTKSESTDGERGR